ncbi:hypothetical protein Ciccas_013562 [Cichlidogyrus casuarinus]|uniref:Uncharacterized protein n=1 Tax=Cichlidogyrus casuarinus TaxID=1844966 RepID=A0ABD2PK92_9PLAT
MTTSNDPRSHSRFGKILSLLGKQSSKDEVSVPNIERQQQRHPTALPLACHRIILHGNPIFMRRRLELALESGQEYEELALMLRKILFEAESMIQYRHSSNESSFGISKRQTPMPKLMTINEIYESTLADS